MTGPGWRRAESRSRCPGTPRPSTPGHSLRFCPSHPTLLEWPSRRESATMFVAKGGTRHGHRDSPVHPADRRRVWQTGRPGLPRGTGPREAESARRSWRNWRDTGRSVPKWRRSLGILSRKTISAVLSRSPASSLSAIPIPCKRRPTCRSIPPHPSPQRPAPRRLSDGRSRPGHRGPLPERPLAPDSRQGGRIPRSRRRHCLRFRRRHALHPGLRSQRPGANLRRGRFPRISHVSSGFPRGGPQVL